MLEPAGAGAATDSVGLLGIEGDIVIRRGTWAGPGGVPTTALLISAAAHPADPATAARLRHGWDLRGALDPAWAAVPLGFADGDGAAVLALADPGGALLLTLLHAPWEGLRFVRAALALARAVGQMHGAGLVHRDLKPSHFVLDEARGHAWITGFTIATMAADAEPGRIAGTYAYMAPEQTGHMNRTVDARSDLYALGVTLYQMLAGALPFHANTPAAWIHSHLARSAAPPEEVRGQGAGMLSRIVLTLLAKNPDERYQCADVLADDLRRCLADLEDAGAIAPFTPAPNGRARRLVLPQHLYGRDAALDSLALAFERARGKPATELVLVAGYSGSGKSALVAELGRTAPPPHTFVTGKFDQYKRAIPFSTLAQVCEALVARVLALAPDEVATWRVRLVDALGENAPHLVHVAPGVAALLGPVPEPASSSLRQALPPDFHLLFRRFFQVFARPGAPLVLFLDDVQWVDTASLRLLEALVAGNDVRHLLLILAYRDNEVGPAHPLHAALALFRAAGARTRTLVMQPLSVIELARLVADTLALAAAPARGLAALLHAKTGGNPFFVILFLDALIDAGLLRFHDGQWHWDDAQIAAQAATDNVVDLMAARLQRLSSASQRALGRFACLGHAASTRALAAVLQVPPAGVETALREAEGTGLVRREGAGYVFLHDRVQEAAYGAYVGADAARLQLDIGRLLHAAYRDDERIEHAFEIASQLNAGGGQALAQVTDPAERRAFARLNWQAGLRARGATAHAAALGYFSAGCLLVDAALWAADFALAFDLVLRRGEAQFLTGELAAAEATLDSLAPRAGRIVDRAALAWMQITLFTAAGQLDRAIATCLAYLREVGVDWSATPGRAQAWEEYAPIAARIRAGEVGAILALPDLEDAEREATLDVLVAVLPPAFFSNEDFVCLVLCRIANLSIAHGNADASALGYAYLGMMLGPYFGEYDAGYRFGEVGYRLVEAGRCERFRARVTMCFGYHVMPWTRPIRAGLPLLRRAFDEAREAGDLTYMGFSSCTLITSLLAGGSHLREVQAEAENKLALIRRARFALIATIIATQLQLVRALRGLTGHLGSFDGDGFAEQEVEGALAADPSLAIARCWYAIRKMQAHYFAGDDRAALGALEAAAPLLWTTGGHFELAEFHFYGALVRARCAALETGAAHAAQRAALAVHAGLVAGWAASGPDNFNCRAALVAAETARLDGQPMAALRLYESAIRQAAEQRFLYVDAIACERAADLCAAEKLDTLAATYLKAACQAYQAWGAEGKVRQLAGLHPQLFDAPAPVENVTIGARLDAMDLASVLKTSEAISGQIGIERLVGTLMAIVLEHSGADRALLILPRDNALWVEGEADTRRHGTAIARPHVLLAECDAPAGMIHQVIRDGAALLVDDAARAHPFGADPYFARTACRSVFCFPLLKQRRLIGVLYLENSLAPHVFTAARQRVLSLLASQAAVALENAALEENGALLKEVHHRVKNNLQLISSLLNRQAGHIADPAVAGLFHESRNRVRAMALVHENLYRAGNYARVPMGEHVINLCRQIARAYGLNAGRIALTTEADDMQLDLDRAVSCGLLINELITNALKHAFPHDGGGTIHVRLQRQSGNLCLLTVRDDGAGMAGDSAAAAAPAGSLGLQLIQDLTDQLGGSKTVEHLGGTRVAITFPLDLPLDGGGAP
jgi:predicted ATPase/two-component sensor histidine kinase